MFQTKISCYKSTTMHTFVTAFLFPTMKPILIEQKRDTFVSLKQRYQDSNLEMPESESGALPFGDSAIILRGLEDSNPRPFGP